MLDKVLFGSDYAFSTIQRTRAGLEEAAAHCRQLGIADISSHDVTRICERDSLRLLGIDPARRR